MINRDEDKLDSRQTVNLVTRIGSWGRSSRHDQVYNAHVDQLEGVAYLKNMIVSVRI